MRVDRGQRTVQHIARHGYINSIATDITESETALRNLLVKTASKTTREPLYEVRARMAFLMTIAEWGGGDIQAIFVMLLYFLGYFNSTANQIISHITPHAPGLPSVPRLFGREALLLPSAA